MTDALGSVRLTLDNNGTAYSGATYDPWGSPERGSVGTFGFTGELQQGDNVYLRARWYNAANGTFTSFRWRTRESNDFAPYTHHGYAYALSNPVLYTDPTGKCVPEWVPFVGEDGCTLSAGIGQGRLDWEAGGKTIQAISEPFVHLGEAVYQDITRSPQQRVDDYINYVKKYTPLGLLSGDPLSIPLGPSNIRFFWDQGEGFVNSAVALGSDLTCGDPYRFLRGLSTIERDLLLGKGGMRVFKQIGGGVRYRNRPVEPIEVTYEMRLNPNLYIQEVVKKYGINLRGSGRIITVKYNPNLASEGLSRQSTPDIIEIGPRAFSSEANLANTIAHELNHARSWLKGGTAPENPAYAAGDALEDYIMGGR